MLKQLAALALVALLAASCGDQVDGGSRTQTTNAGDAADGGAYFFDRVHFVRDVLQPDVAGQPATLSSALPCGAIKRPGAARAVVMGTVTAVEPGDAKIWGEEEDSVTYAADFYDPEVDERNVVVTVEAETVTTESGTSRPDQPVQIRIGVLGGAEPDQFMASLKSMGRVVGLLSELPDGPHKGEYYPSLGGAGLGLLTADGAVRFPGLGDREGEFVGQLISADAVLSVCR